MVELSRDINFNDEMIGYSAVEKLKASKGDRIRLAFISPAIKQAFRHYHPRAKKFFRCRTTDWTKPAVCCHYSKEPPDQRFTVLVFVYDTSFEGDLLTLETCNGAIKVWDMTERMYKDLSATAKLWPLLDKGFDSPQHDLFLHVTKNKFADFSCHPMRECHLKTRREWYDQIQARMPRASLQLEKTLGTVLSEAEICQLYGMGTVDPQLLSPASKDVDLSGFAVVEPRLADTIGVNNEMELQARRPLEERVPEEAKQFVKGLGTTIDLD